MQRSEKCSRKSWDFRQATIAFDSAFKKIELVANCKFSERQTRQLFGPEVGLDEVAVDLLQARLSLVIQWGLPLYCSSVSLFAHPLAIPRRTA